MRDHPPRLTHSYWLSGSHISPLAIFYCILYTKRPSKQVVALTFLFKIPENTVSWNKNARQDIFPTPFVMNRSWLKNISTRSIWVLPVQRFGSHIRPPAARMRVSYPQGWKYHLSSTYENLPSSANIELFAVIKILPLLNYASPVMKLTSVRMITAYIHIKQRIKHSHYKVITTRGMVYF